MRLQGMSIVFALVSLPIILVIAYYISLQIDTITLQNKYNERLLGATYDAMSAFELNTANEDLSSVSDSLRTIIEASCNIFMNTLSTNFGMSNASKSHLEPFIPAMLYTLYDGYYIYAPTYAPTVITDSDGNAVSVGDLGVTANSDGTYNYTEYVEVINEATGEITNKLTPDQEKNIRISYDNSNFSNKIDYGQLLYYTKNTVKTDNPDGGVSYTNCTASIEPSTLTDTGATKAEYKTKNVLKSYIPYSARYVQKLDSVDGQPTADINVIYTLDNYVTVEGTFTYPSSVPNNRTIYWTKSGYLVPFTQSTAEGESGILSVRISFNGSDFESPLKYNQNEIQEYIEAGNPIIVEVLKDIKHPENGYERIIEINDSNKAVIDKTNTNLSSDTVKLTRYENILFDLEEAIANPTLPDASKNEIMNNAFNMVEEAYKSGVSVNNYNSIINALRLQINDVKYRTQLNSAAVYYSKAAIFSNWVKDNLSDLKINSIQDISGLNYATYLETLGGDTEHNLWNDDGKVFDFTNGRESMASTEIMQDSSFYTHKLAIIRSSIQYNLNLSMSAYNRHLYYDDSQTYALNTNTDYTMPIMKESEWEQILSNISIVSFMQGIQCGLKEYNNYAVVSSSNNEIMTSPENVYYAKIDEFNNETSEYHTYNCKKVFNQLKEGSSENRYISFTSKEVKYDKISTKSSIIPYRYDHKNYACYECINDGNYRGADIFNITESDGDASAKETLRKSFYIGIAKERNDIYKMNAVKNSEGYEILYFDGKVNISDSVGDKNTTDSLLDIDKIKQIEVTFGPVNTDRRDEASLTFAVQYNTDGQNLRSRFDSPTESMLYSIPTNTTNKYTWNLEVEPTISNSGKFRLQKLIFKLLNEDTSSFMINTSYSNPSEKLKSSIQAIRIIYK